MPTLKELQWVMEGGNGYEYGTNDGSISIDNVVYRGSKRDPKAAQKSLARGQQLDGKQKGHPQPVASFAQNPYGIYNLAGSVVEWTKTKDHNKDLGCRQATRFLPGQEAFVRLGGAWPRPEESCRINACINTSKNIGNDHFGFRVVKRTN